MTAQAAAWSSPALCQRGKAQTTCNRPRPIARAHCKCSPSSFLIPAHHRPCPVVAASSPGPAALTGCSLSRLRRIGDGMFVDQAFGAAADEQFNTLTPPGPRNFVALATVQPRSTSMCSGRLLSIWHFSEASAVWPRMWGLMPRHFQCGQTQ